MRINKRLAVGLSAAIMTLTSCSFNPTAQKGYDRIKSEIKAAMRDPSSYKGEKVECYWDVQSITYAYQYKVSFSGTNAFGGRVSTTAYYGYSDGLDAIRKYGTDSSYFSAARSRGEKQSIVA